MEDRLTWYVSWLAYPLVMLAALALHAVIGSSLDSPALSANLPVVLAALLVTLLEIRFPKHRLWRPGMREVRNDIAYMVIVQMILPRIVVFLLILALVQPIQSVWTVLPGLWPHEAPLWLQAVLMIMAADFLRYWLHVAAHRNRYLWRLHAVHHSPHRLYWLNVGRFHPLEKILQMFLDTLPFILLGVSEPVIAMYFVFYAVNGFFQHSNIELRYGLLNYVISGAELHRWHHSRLPEESNRNYGNNLIVWDLLFGTWFLPRDREVDALGLKNRGYPLQISDQLKTPFTPDIAEREVPLQGFGRLGFRMLMWLRMQAVFLLHVLPWLIRAGHPRKVQMKLLEKIVAGNRKTRFGQEHGFGQIRSHADYIQQVPIQDYETLRHWIASQEEGVPALTRKSPVMYALTSGTSAEPKLLPVTRPAMRQFDREQKIFSWVMYHHCPAAFHCSILGFVSPAREGVRASGIPYGSVSGEFYKSMPKPFQRLYVVPPQVFDIEDYNIKYRVILRLALATPEITSMAGANPSSFLRLLEILNASREEMIHSLETGELADLKQLDSGLRASIASLITPSPIRASYLRKLQGRQELGYADLWPGLRLLSVWTGGSCGIPIAALKERLPEAASIVELGFLASEFRGTITLDTVSGDGLPTLDHNVFEFVERGAWEAGERDILCLDELVEGGEYYIIVTTISGLYRYFMNDIVRVTGRYRQTPLLRFVQKGQGTTSITGEKLYEDQVLQALARAEQTFGFFTRFVMALADELNPGYRLYLEATRLADIRLDELAADFDATLQELNIEYKNKRDSGRLRPLAVLRLQSGTGEAYKAHRIARGQREGQYKYLILRYQKDFDFDLSACLHQ